MTGRLRVLLVSAHPLEASFHAAQVAAAREALSAHDLDHWDLYAEGFDPVMTAEERARYHDPAWDRAPLRPHLDRLAAAQALVIVAPVWNFGPPAVLKGFYDRLFLPGLTFALRAGRVVPGALRLTALAAVHTYGAPRWQAFLAGDPPRAWATRVLPRTLRPAHPVRFVAHYAMNVSTPDSRARHLARVRAQLSQL